ncbi:Transposase, L1 containing protein [Cricetulus griseus]|nr:Transposase, L1 containing protein [Cricetulus griseus]
MSITNRIQETEERISAIEDSLEDIHSSTKENLKSNRSLTQNIEEIWDTVKRPNLRIIGIEEGEETLLKGFEELDLVLGYGTLHIIPSITLCRLYDDR